MGEQEDTFLHLTWARRCSATVACTTCTLFRAIPGAILNPKHQIPTSRLGLANARSCSPMS